MSKVTDLNSLLHHIVNTAKLETEEEWRLAHEIIDTEFPTTPPLDKTPSVVKKTTPPLVEVPFTE